MNDYLTEKGQEGERIVAEAVRTLLGEEVFAKRVFQNVVMPFESVYGFHFNQKLGWFGKCSTEFDSILITENYIYLFEVKNESYLKCGYGEKEWKLRNGDIVSNPLDQNHAHKLVFCAEMGIPRERVITIEVLLQNGKKPYQKSKYPNDVVLSKEDLSDVLPRLFRENVTGFPPFNVDALVGRFMEISSKTEYAREKHVKVLEEVERAEKRIEEALDWYNFKRTDVARCNLCGGYLHFFPFHRDKYDKRTKVLYALKCENAPKDCNAKLIYIGEGTATEEYRNVRPISIEERMGWGEEDDLLGWT